MGGGAKRGENMGGGINRPASKGNNKDDADSWGDHYWDMRGKEEVEW